MLQYNIYASHMHIQSVIMIKLSTGCWFIELPSHYILHSQYGLVRFWMTLNFNVVTVLWRQNLVFWHTTLKDSVDQSHLIRQWKNPISLQSKHVILTLTFSSNTYLFYKSFPSALHYTYFTRVFHQLYTIPILQEFSISFTL
jgi:hypothetical protein